MSEPASLARDVELVGVAETASRLRVSAERIRQLAKSGDMPPPIGRLGRQMVWQWRDVENWARKEGRLPDSHGAPKRVRPNRDDTPLKLVVNELMTWGRRSTDICHVRVWAPTGERGSHVVLLGQLQDRDGRSVTNNIEDVAMTAAARYVGSAWQSAQFYEYQPASDMFDHEAEFHHVTFAVESLPRGRRQRQASAPAAAALGAVLVRPSWRRTDREELLERTGDVPAVWVPGTYTRELISATADMAMPAVIWDPLRARDLMDVIEQLSALRVGTTADAHARFGVELDLPLDLLEVARTIAGQAALEALEYSEQDVRTQPVDAAIALTAVRVNNTSLVHDAARTTPVEDLDPVAVWQTLSLLRRAVVAATKETDPAIVRRRRVLVPGRCSGLVELPNWQANVDDQPAPGRGLYGPIATASDVVNDTITSRHIAPFDRLLLLDAILSEHLQQHWPDWGWHDIPAFSPSEDLSVDGPLTHAYLSTVKWRPLSEVDEDRLHRLKGVIEGITRVGYDPDGWLVAANKRYFACEWPVSGEEDSTLAEALVRADRPNPSGPTAVFLQRGDRLSPLPSSPHRYDGNAFTWGYSGAGPANLADAILDVCWRAGVIDDPHSSRWTRSVRSLVSRPHPPDWRVRDILDLADDALAARGGRPP